jgi:serine/alanine adding enzyme
VKNPKQKYQQAATSAIVELAEQEHQRWDAFVASHPNASVYHMSVWRDLIKRLFGHQSYYLSARHTDGTIAGVLPLVRLRSRLFGDFLTSMPYVNYGGAIAVNTETEEALMDRACEVAGDLGCRHIEFRDARKRDNRWPVRTDKVVMELVLPNAVDILWSDLGSKIRAQIKRSTNEAIEAFRGGKELLTEFYAVFARNMRDLGTPVYPRDLFGSILEAFPEKTNIVVVRHRDRPVAAAFLLGFGSRLEIPWASSIRDYNRFGVNMLLYWEVLKFTIELGYEIFDFGRSTIDSGTHRFKAQWGARERQLYWHYWLQEGQGVPQLTPQNPRYQLAVKAWQHLPLWLANSLGPRIVKNLP